MFNKLVSFFLIISSATLLAQDNEYVSGQNEFSYKLLQHLQPTRENICFSSYNISRTCALAYLGAGGATRDQMREALRFPHQKPELFASSLNDLTTTLAPVFESAEAIALDASFAPEKSYLELVQKRLGAETFEVDFIKRPDAAVISINSWAEEKTHGKITNLLQRGDVTSLTKMVLLGACYCKADWQQPFELSRTKKQPFYTFDGKNHSVPMMRQLSRLRHYANQQLSVVWLECESPKEKGPKIQAVIILPRDEAAWSDISSQMTPEMLSDWYKKSTHLLVDLSLPKCTLKQRTDLKKALESMGMTDAFSGAADFSLISPTADLLISKVIHEAYLELNETGIVAAAATAIPMAVKSALIPAAEVTMKCDHPFLVLLQEKKNELVLFTGFVANP